MSGLSLGNFIMDFVLVAAAIWMVLVVRGVGGVMGRTLTLIVIGAIILGFAHLIATLMAPVFNDAVLNNFVHRVIVLVGFLLLVAGFRQVSAMK